MIKETAGSKLIIGYRSTGYFMEGRKVGRERNEGERKQERKTHEDTM